MVGLRNECFACGKSMAGKILLDRWTDGQVDTYEILYRLHAKHGVVLFGFAEFLLLACEMLFPFLSLSWVLFLAMQRYTLFSKVWCCSRCFCCAPIGR